MTHAPISEVMAMDGVLFKAAAKEAEAAQWEPLHDLVATNTEVLHGIYRLMIGALTKSKMPEPLRIPRPDRPDLQPKPKRIAMTAGDLARHLRGDHGD